MTVLALISSPDMSLKILVEFAKEKTRGVLVETEEDIRKIFWG